MTEDAPRPRGAAPPLEELEAVLGHRFGDRAELLRALTHSSRAHEEGGATDGNERLEFLGDAVLDLVVSHALMSASPDASEGQLSRTRAELVRARSLARYARRIDLGRWLRLGRGEERQGGRDRSPILADAFEAVLGALFLDGGYAAAREFVERALGEELGRGVRPVVDPKTQLQEHLQATGDALPQYETLAATGPPHAREFEVVVRVAGEVLGTGTAGSKKEAAQLAAREALEALEG